MPPGRRPTHAHRSPGAAAETSVGGDKEGAGDRRRPGSAMGVHSDPHGNPARGVAMSADPDHVRPAVAAITHRSMSSMQRQRTSANAARPSSSRTCGDPVSHVRHRAPSSPRLFGPVQQAHPSPTHHRRPIGFCRGRGHGRARTATPSTVAADVVHESSAGPRPTPTRPTLGFVDGRPSRTHHRVRRAPVRTVSREPTQNVTG